MDYLLLSLRFFPWIILSIFTLFIGLFWLIPYINVSYARFYDGVRRMSDPDLYDDDDVTKHLIDDLV